MNLSIEFVARSHRGSVSVAVTSNQDPRALGCDESARDFPVCEATVAYTGVGYDGLLGWVQLVGVGDPPVFENDPLRIYDGLQTPFAFYGLSPTLFDAPSRRDRTRDLQWLAHSFLCVSPSGAMEHDVLAVLGFSWGLSSRVVGSRSASRVY